MRLTIELALDNAAFEPFEPGDSFDGAEVQRAVREAIDRARRGAWDTPIIDLNGNQVGSARVTP